MPAILFVKCQWCTAGCNECSMTGYVAILPTLEQVRAVLDGVPAVEQLKCDLSIARSHCDSYAKENDRLRQLLTEGSHASE